MKVSSELFRPASNRLTLGSEAPELLRESGLCQIAAQAHFRQPRAKIAHRRLNGSGGLCLIKNHI